MKSKKKEIHIGVTPSSSFNNGKQNFQILSIGYNAMDFMGDLISIVIECNEKVETVKISSQEAISLGFINPSSLEPYCK